MADKLCPMKFSRSPDGRDGFCSNELCAWWEEFTGHCGMVMMARMKGKDIAFEETFGRKRGELRK